MKDTPLAPSLPAGPETAEARGARLDWWADARFGMFVHWGLYSLLGRG